MKFDLHVHTDSSDGTMSYKEVIDLGLKQKLSGIAITDHDNVDSIEGAMEYASSLEDFKLIPGIEFSCVYQGEEVHILGYFIDYKDSSLLKLTEELKESRISRGIKTVEKINSLGMELTIEEVKSFSKGDFIGRPHIARALKERGYVDSVSQAFKEYLGMNKPAYVERYKIEVSQVIKLIKDLGGVSILAHPGLIRDKKIIDYCIDQGINGLEGIYPQHSNEDFKYFLEKARERDLILTGGSDFHGDRYEKLLLGEYYIGRDTIEKMEMIR